MPPEDIINQVRYPNEIVGYMRPDIEALKDNDLDYNTPDYVIGKNIKSHRKGPKFLASIYWIFQI